MKALRSTFYLQFLLLDVLKTAFQMRHSTHIWTQLGYFFLKSEQFSLILKKRVGEASLPLPPLCARLY